MKESSILRLAIISQATVGTTVDKYICNIVKQLLSESAQVYMSSIELSKLIEEEFDLFFTPNEIDEAIKKKGKKELLSGEQGYSLTPKAISSLSTNNSIEDNLNVVINRFCISNSTDFEETKLEILNFIYYCFNSSASNLLSLLRHDVADFSKVDDYSGNIEIVNAFIRWNDQEKDELLYKLISSSYEYCMLTVKKDNLNSKKIFSGKVFILDSNIIFRMAGINNDERMYVISSFVTKCKSVGITLCYTNETYAELLRVITQQVKYIKKMTNSQYPISPDNIELVGSYYSSDFYKAYYQWCKMPGNTYNDYVSFKNYLTGLMNDIISDLKYIQVDNMKKKDKEDNLLSYKQSKHPNRNITYDSIRCDINNMEYVVGKRNEQNQSVIFNTNEFIVSADHLLISWGNEEYPGVPIAVLPSVWLSIILRFTGRAENDFKAFCLFLSLRTNEIETSKIDAEKLVNSLSKKTIDTTIKEEIINHIVQHQEDYSFEDDMDYDKVVDLAFDILLKERDKDHIEQLKTVDADYKKEINKVKQDNELERQEIIDNQINTMVGGHVNKKMRFFENNPWLSMVTKIITGIVILFTVFVVVSCEPLRINITILMDPILKNDTVAVIVSTIITVMVESLLMLMGDLFEYLGSDKRRSALSRKYRKKLEEEYNNGMPDN